MENMNVADVFGTLFLIYGVIDGYRKGFVKKGILFASSILTLVIVYMASPYVAGFFREILPICLFTGKCAGDGQRNLYHAGIKRPG